MKKEPLDFCRIKKLHDKGFGFLQSLYYPQEVFFHFSKIKDAGVKETLAKMQRGKIYIYFTSELVENKRRAKKIWFDVKDAPPELIPDFIEKIIEEFNSGTANPYELAFAVRNLLKNGLLSSEKFRAILLGNRILRIPNIVIAFAPEKSEVKEELERILQEIENGITSYPTTVNSITDALMRERTG